jgi:hypothetical protein
VEPGNISVLEWAIKTERIVKLHCKPLTRVETAGKTFQTHENSEFVRISLAKIPYIITFRKYSPFFRKNIQIISALCLLKMVQSITDNAAFIRYFSDRDFAILVNVQF